MDSFRKDNEVVSDLICVRNIGHPDITQNPVDIEIDLILAGRHVQIHLDTQVLAIFDSNPAFLDFRQA